MHTSIVVVKMPDLLHTESFSQKWQNFIGEVDSLRKAEPDPIVRQSGVLRIAENVWQVNLQLNPGALARLIYFATQFGLEYGILPLDAAPQWLPAGFDPSTT